MITDRTLCAVPADPHRAAALAMQDAVHSRHVWRCHGQARRLTDRIRLADLPDFYKAQAVRTANHLISLAEPAS